MSVPRRAELPYRRDSEALFDLVAGEPWAAFLDSGRPHGNYGRYDILCADPSLTLTTRGACTEIRTRHTRVESEADPFDLLRVQLGPSVEGEAGLPFIGGAVGYFGYDLARRLERLPAAARDDMGLPEMAVGIYDWAVVVDHALHRAWLVGAFRDPRTSERWEELYARFAEDAAPRTGRWGAVGAVRSNMTESDYAGAFARVQSYIREGDCYQVNLAQRFEVSVEGDPWAGYRRLRRLSPAPYGAYLNHPDAQVLSVSPEAFLQVREGRVETRPIKGTRPRALDPRADTVLREELRHSAKDRAENLMIVDLLRNDIGKSCRPGSVKVPALFSAESHPTVHHLVSTVTGELATDADALTLLRGCFPGGSITGAPKLRAMEIIEELEPHRRGVYCGALGYVGFDGAMQTNIAIRTLVQRAGKAWFWAGGGIVHDSDREGEYRETFDKAAAMLRLVEDPV